MADIQMVSCGIDGTTVRCFTQSRTGVRSTDDYANVFGVCFRFV